MPDYEDMSEARLREWVEAHPGRINNTDGIGDTPLVVAATTANLLLAVWLLDEKGADVNATTSDGEAPLHRAPTPDIVSVLLDHGADPTLLNCIGWTPLMQRVKSYAIDTVACLLQYPSVRATVNVQDHKGDTALHYACRCVRIQHAAPIARLLLQANADPNVTNNEGLAPLAFLRAHYPNRHDIIALLERAPDSEKASLLVKARLVVAAAISTVAPSCLQDRVTRGRPMPGVAMAAVVGGHDDGKEEECRKLHTALAFMCGLGREGMPRDVFRVVMDLLMPPWDPLRRKGTSAGQQS